MSLFDKILKPLVAIFGSSYSKKKARKTSHPSRRAIKTIRKKTRTVKKRPETVVSSSQRGAPQKKGKVSRRSSSDGKLVSASPRTQVSKSVKNASPASRALASAGAKESSSKTGRRVSSKVKSGGSPSLKAKSSAGSLTNAAPPKAVKKTPSTSKEILVGEITHYFSRIQVAVLKMTAGALKLKESLRVRGAQTDFYQTVTSMQIESADVKIAKKGQLVGLKVEREVRVGDKVYKTE